MIGKQSDKEIPTTSAFFLEVGLYELFKVPESNSEKVYDIIYCDKPIDTYCNLCNQNSTFQPVDNYPGFDSNQSNSQMQKPRFAENQYKINTVRATTKWGESLIEKRFKCARDSSHTIKYIIRYEAKKDPNFVGTNIYVEKIGQHPSIADLASAELTKYRSILEEKQFNEFRKGVGLFSHGIGIGAFVYLRRIVEDIIEEGHLVASKSEGWEDGDYQGKRIGEKISALADYLPNTLVQNKAIYGILSKGIHELTEDECKSYFPAIRLAIELILDEKIEKSEKLKKEKEIKDTIGKITNEMTSR